MPASGRPVVYTHKTWFACTHRMYLDFLHQSFVEGRTLAEVFRQAAQEYLDKHEVERVKTPFSEVPYNQGRNTANDARARRKSRAKPDRFLGSAGDGARDFTDCAV